MCRSAQEAAVLGPRRVGEVWPVHAAGSLTTAPSWSIVRPGGGSAVSGGVSLAFSGMVTVVQPKRGALLTLQIRRERHTVVP